MRSIRSRHRGSSSRNDGSFWLNFSDLMSSLLLIIILIMFYIKAVAAVLSHAAGDDQLHVMPPSACQRSG